MAANIVIVLPLSSPTAKGVFHLQSAEDEDNNPLYDTNPEPFIVEWKVLSGGEDHIITEDYLVKGSRYTLIIPPMDYTGDPLAQSVILFKSPGPRIEVRGGTLLTNGGTTQFARTAFLGENGFWDGLIIRGGSCNINGSLIRGAANGIVFDVGTRMEPPGIFNSRIDYMNGYGVQFIGGISGYTYVTNCTFDDTAKNKSTSIWIQNGKLNVSSSTFVSHGDNKPQLNISDSDVKVDYGAFIGYGQPGSLVYITGNSNGTMLSNCFFQEGAPGDYLVGVRGSSVFIDNCTFTTSSGELSVIANEDDANVPGHVIIRNPKGSSDGFDNATMNATGDSSITLQWYMNVHVIDPNGNPIPHAPVWVTDRIGDPADPSCKITDADGWARWITVTELIQYEDDVINFNPFNVWAENNSMIGYAVPDPIMNMSRDVIVTVPFNPIPNTLPVVSSLPTPAGIQSGLVEIEYELSDPDPGDDGNLSVKVYYSFDNKMWFQAAQGPGGDPTDWLSNDTVYYFVWNSSEDIPDLFAPTVYIKIVPYDRAGSGTPSYTGDFAVDNQAPFLLEGPTVTVTDTTALIEWEVDERANATVWYGPGDTMTLELWNYSYSPSQSILLTGLQPGRYYTYVINSTDPFGQKYTSYPTTFTFDTQVGIPLYEGWNMISLPPLLLDAAVEDVLASISGQYDIVEAYDASDPIDPWKCYNIYKPEELNDLHQITSFMGLWIHALNDTVLIPDHIDPTQDPMFPGTYIHLYQGWNMVGYPSIKTRTVIDALSGTEYNLVQTYDAASGEWWEYDGESGDLTHMEMGRGYWIHTDEGQDWLVSYV